MFYISPFKPIERIQKFFHHFNHSCYKEIYGISRNDSNKSNYLKETIRNKYSFNNLLVSNLKYILLN